MKNTVPTPFVGNKKMNGGPGLLANLALAVVSELAAAPDIEVNATLEGTFGRIGLELGAARAILFRLAGTGQIKEWLTWTAPGIADSALPVAEFEAMTLASGAFHPIGSFRAQKSDWGWFGLRFGGDTGGVLALCAPLPAHQILAADPDAAGMLAQGLYSATRRHDRVLAAMQQQDALTLSALRHKAMLEALPDIVVEVDEDGRFTHVQARNLYDLVASPDESLGKRLEDVLPPDVALMRRDMMRELDMGRVPEAIRYQIETPRGLRCQHASASRYLFEDTPRYVFLVRDVTREVDQMNELASVGDIAKQTGNLVMVTDVQQRIKWVNEAFVQRTGYTLDEVRGKRPVPLLQCERTDPDTVAFIRDSLKAGKPAQTAILNRSKTGEEYWLQTNIQPTRAANGEVIGFLAVQADITERVQLEKELTLRRHEAIDLREQLTEAIESLEEAFALFDAEDRLQFFNKRYLEFYAEGASIVKRGVTFEEMERFAMEIALIPEAVGNEEAWLESRIAARRSGGADLEQTLPDGRIIHVVERRTAGGSLICIHSDISKLKYAEQRLLNVIEGAAVGTWEWNLVTSEQSINNGWAEMIGYQASDFDPFRYDDWVKLVHPEDIGSVEEKVAACVAGHTDTYESEYRMRHKNQEWVWIADRGKVIRRGPDGQAEFMAGVQINISEHKARETALILAKSELEAAIQTATIAEGRFEHIASFSKDWVFEMDENLRFSFVMDGKYFGDGGIPAGDLLGKSLPEWIDLRPDMKSAADWAGLSAAMAKQEEIRDFVYRAPLTGDGEERWRSLIGTPRYDASGAFAGYRGVVVDITQLYAARARAEDSSRTKSMFLANMSHEIRTPLNGVLGMAEVLDAEITDPGQKRMIGTIRRSGAALLNILNDILDMSKIEAGKLDLESAPFNIVEMAGRVEDLHSLRAQEKGLGLEVMIGSGTASTRLGDTYRVQQILHNLIGNAIKFTEQGAVEVKISGRTGMPLVIDISDTGIGMTAEQVETIHEEFSQADSSVTRRFGGTGLGMAITRSLVEKMGGTIKVKSAVGEGTQVKVTLPLPEGKELAEAKTGVMQAQNDLGGLRVLAADDNATNCEVLTLLLERAGAEVTVVRDGAQAVAAWAPNLFDAILLDISMPVMDGPTALSKIRALEAEHGGQAIPVIAVTANAMAHQVADYIMQGFDACIAKPINSAGLVKAILSLTKQG